MSELFAPVCSITSTKRRRFFWAAWWSAPPRRMPFRRPDAASGGAATWEEALAAAEKAAGIDLTPTDPSWARAWNRVLRGQTPFADRTPGAPATRGTKPGARAATNEPSVWSVLGVAEGADAAALKLAFRRRALELHPDHGGDAVAFQRLLHAYEEARKRARKPRSKTKPQA